MSVDELPYEILEGELVWAVLTVENIGAEAACDVVIKTNRPYCVFYQGVEERPEPDAKSDKYKKSRLSNFGNSGN